MTSKVTSLSRAEPAERAQFVAIVDDDEAVRRALVRLLEAYSFQVRTYPSVREFLDSLKIGVPACLIVDLQMKDMTGLELLHHLSGMGLRIPAIVVTADDEPGLPDRCKLAGAIAFLVKPVMRDPLMDALKAAMSAPDCAAAQSRAK